MVYLSDMVENTLQKIPMDVLISFKEYYIQMFKETKKSQIIQICDIVFSITLIIILFPVLLLGIILEKIEDGKEIFYKQTTKGE